VLGAVRFAEVPLSFLAMPVWVDELEARLKRAVQARIVLEIAQRRLSLLNQASRKIAQRVNLFERVLIPQIREGIRKIQIALGDVEREAVVRSKLAKSRHHAIPVAEGENPA
jgi:V/A-type H+/Na+-transporting ATPase subunit D